MHDSLLGVAAAVGIYWGIKALRAHASRADVLWAFAEGKNWIIWWVLLFLLTRRGDHPPTQDDALSRRRKWVAWATLALFVVLFMPVPFRVH